MKTKILAAVTVAASGIPAFAIPFSVTDHEIAAYEAERNLKGFKERLLNAGILIQDKRPGLYVVKDADLGAAFDDETIMVISDLVYSISAGRVATRRTKVELMEDVGQDGRGSK